MTVDAAAVAAFIRDYAAVIAENRTKLTELDAAIGDADHGENMNRGFQAVLDKLATEHPDTPADLLKLVAMTLISKVGGASGPLYGTAFLRASTAVAGKTELDVADVLAALDAAKEGVVARGKAALGDKTMIDVWEPALAAAHREADGGAELPAVLAAATAAAEEGLRATVPLVAHKGRASYLGERSAGHQDPGATSSYLMFRTMTCDDDAG